MENKRLLRTNFQPIAPKVQRQLFLRQGAVLCMAALAACTGIRQRDGEPSDLERFKHYAGEPIASFSTISGVSGWLPLSRDRLVVWTRLDEAYLLTVVPTCLDLQHAPGIALISKVRSSVESGFDSVRVQRDICRITEIRKVDYRLMKQEERESR